MVASPFASRHLHHEDSLVVPSVLWARCPPISLIHNERTKLTASWLDRASTAALTLGVVAPLAAAVFGYPDTPVSAGNLLIGIGFWFPQL